VSTTQPLVPNAKRNPYGDTETAKQQDLDDVYELGETTISLKMMIKNGKITTSNGITKYKKYQKLASKFGVALLNPPLETEIDTKFFCEQIYDAEKEMENKPNHIAYSYNAAVQLEESRRIIDDNYSQLKVHLQQLERAAEKLDKNISAELNHLKNLRHCNTKCVHSIKRKLFKVKRSQVDRARIITNDSWAISLVRLRDTHLCTHACLILEKKEANKSSILFADFVAAKMFSFKSKAGKVRKEERSEDEFDSPDELLYSCTEKKMKIKKGSRFLYSTWPISKAAAQKLITNLEEKKENPPPFEALWNLSSNSTGYNSFTFATNLLHNLNEEHIQVPGDTLDEWIASAASQYHVGSKWWWAILREFFSAIFMPGCFGTLTPGLPDLVRDTIISIIQNLYILQSTIG
jgi:hypothetical protein